MPVIMRTSGLGNSSIPSREPIRYVLLPDCWLDVIHFTRIEVAIKVIRSAFTDEEVKQFNQVGGMIRGDPLDLGF